MLFQFILGDAVLFQRRAKLLDATIVLLTEFLEHRRSFGIGRLRVSPDLHLIADELLIHQPFGRRAPLFGAQVQSLPIDQLREAQFPQHFRLRNYAVANHYRNPVHNSGAGAPTEDQPKNSPHI